MCEVCALVLVTDSNFSLGWVSYVVIFRGLPDRKSYILKGIFPLAVTDA